MITRNKEPATRNKKQEASNDGIFCEGVELDLKEIASSLVPRSSQYRGFGWKEW
ncbi:MAG: hypothetical protein GXO88_08725 [Chlorobi bacterium]|nr:hypothetical protein [Chlorobiota bacterium]